MSAPGGPRSGEESTATIDVAFTAAEIRPAQVAVVIDVLRATSTMVTALGAGYRRVLCTATPEEARRLRAPGRLLAGERHCRPIEGFDYGNSPGALQQAKGEELVLCTTNGTPAILSALAAAEEVLIGSLLNLNALIERIPPGRDVTFVCAGTGGRFALEDAYAAGRIVARLEGSWTDAARAAERVASAYDDTYEPLAQSADAAVLRDTDQAADIEFCAQESVSTLVPEVGTVSAEVAAASIPVGAEDGQPVEDPARGLEDPGRNREIFMQKARSSP
ncbi:MAG: 2-phosphosulfolactate phosphatase [Actinomycetota bacterium]|nr:2-phosphosulfolactate phosphatase [Actinomycetota bacterium]